MFAYSFGAGLPSFSFLVQFFYFFLLKESQGGNSTWESVVWESVALASNGSVSLVGMYVPVQAVFKIRCLHNDFNSIWKVDVWRF